MGDACKECLQIHLLAELEHKIKIPLVECEWEIPCATVYVGLSRIVISSMLEKRCLQVPYFPFAEPMFAQVSPIKAQCIPIPYSPCRILLGAVCAPCAGHGLGLLKSFMRYEGLAIAGLRVRTLKRRGAHTLF